MCGCKNQNTCKCENLVTQEEFDKAWAVIMRAKAQGILQWSLAGQWYTCVDSQWNDYRIKPQPVGPETIIVNVYPQGTLPSGRHGYAYESLDHARRAAAEGCRKQVKYIRAPENEQPS